MLFHPTLKASFAPTSLRQIGRLLGLLLAGLWLAACSEPPQDEIVGKWRISDTADGNVLEFYKDGTVTFEEAITGVSINGEYTFLNDEKIKIERGGILAITGASIYTISFPDNRMTLESQNGGDVSTYDKIE